MQSSAYVPLCVQIRRVKRLSFAMRRAKRYFEPNFSSSAMTQSACMVYILPANSPSWPEDVQFVLDRKINEICVHDDAIRRTKLGVILEEHGRRHLLYATYFSFVFLFCPPVLDLFSFFLSLSSLGLRRRFTRANFSFSSFYPYRRYFWSVQESLIGCVCDRENLRSVCC